MFQPAHTKADMQRLKNEDVELLIVGGWHGDALGINPHCRNDLKLARAAGLRTAIYVVVDSAVETDGEGSVQKAKENCGPEWDHASFIAIDVEAPKATIEEVQAGIDAVLREGKTPIIYTARWFWKDTWGDPHEFCDIPLWNAFYDWDSDFDFAENSYGCWSEDQVIAEQYQDTSMISGLEMDHNSFRRDFLTAAEFSVCDGLGQSEVVVLATLYAHAALDAGASCPDPNDANSDGKMNALDVLALLQAGEAES
jgi:GH25 family lysozyme M1 (1,4-beta-N-acetylmuramidase)